MPTATALIFAKYPSPGRVNTRFIPPLSPEQAAELHLLCLRAVVESVRDDSAFDHVVLVATPDNDAPMLRRLIGDGELETWPQGEGDLGTRLVRAVERAFAVFGGVVMLLGADSPTLPTALRHAALTLLSDHDAAMVPATDGGYCALALARLQPALFEQVAWGGPHVAEQTRERAVTGGIRLAEPGTWYDLDQFEDLLGARADIAAMSHPAGAALAVYVEDLVKGHGPDIR